MIKTAYFYTIINPLLKLAKEGGGNQAGCELISNLETLGYQVKVVTPRDEFLNPNLSDLNIYFDIFNDPRGSPWFKSSEYLKLLKSSIPYILMECAYCAMTTNDYGNTKNYKENLAIFSRQFFIHARKVILLSPLHQQEIEKFLGLQLDNVYLHLMEINTTLFNKKDIIKQKDIPYLYVGACNYWKGIDIVIEKYHDKGLKIIGQGHLPQNIGQAEYWGVIDHKDLPKIYNITQNFVHLPRWKEPFGRTMAEAQLCGCNIVGNNNCGYLSWKRDWKISDFTESTSSILTMLKAIV